MVERSFLTNLNAIRVFSAVAELESITRAAKLLGMAKSSVSRDVARLEGEVGATLLLRSNRRVSLTDTGILLHQHAKQILDQVTDAEVAISRVRASPRGLLRISAAVTSGQALITPLLPEFLRRYPEIQISLNLDNAFIDPLLGEIDILIRLGPLPDSSLSARLLMRIDYGLFASPAYLEETAAPTSLEELARHQIVDHGGLAGPRVWIMEGPEGKDEVRVVPRLFVSDPLAVRLAVIGGGGIAWLPTCLTDDDIAAGRLTRVLTRYRRESRDIHALFAPARALSPKVRVFVDFLVEQLGALGLSGK